jgi:hypothetical protein
MCCYFSGGSTCFAAAPAAELPATPVPPFVVTAAFAAVPAASAVSAVPDQRKFQAKSEYDESQMQKRSVAKAMNGISKNVRAHTPT